MKRTTVVLLSALLLMMGFAPASAAPPDNPFVGSWESVSTFIPEVGEEEIHFAIGAAGHIQGQTSVSASCYFAFGEPDIRGSFSGTGEVISEDPYTWEGETDIYCHLRGAGGRQLGSEGFAVSFEYHAATDTLIGLGGDCVWRAGSDASVCPD